MIADRLQDHIDRSASYELREELLGYALGELDQPPAASASERTIRRSDCLATATTQANFPMECCPEVLHIDESILSPSGGLPRTRAPCEQMRSYVPASR